MACNRAWWARNADAINARRAERDAQRRAEARAAAGAALRAMSKAYTPPRAG
jgi:hypothetical protein